MTLFTRDPAVRELVSSALIQGGAEPAQELWVWNARIRLQDDSVIMEGSTPIYLDHILQSLRVFTGREKLPPEWVYLPVHLLPLQEKKARRVNRAKP